MSQNKDNLWAIIHNDNTITKLGSEKPNIKPEATKMNPIKKTETPNTLNSSKSAPVKSASVANQSEQLKPKNSNISTTQNPPNNNQASVSKSPISQNPPNNNQTTVAKLSISQNPPNNNQTIISNLSMSQKPYSKNTSLQTSQQKHIPSNSHNYTSSNNKTMSSPRSASPKKSKIDLPIQSESNPKHPLSEEDKKRQKIANANYQFVKEHPELVSKNSRTIQDSDHIMINNKLVKIKSKFEDIVINNYSTISTAIYYHNQGYQNIYVLNFADAKNAGGGYLNGRNAQEECLCRQTLLYPAIKGNLMYTLNQKYGPEGSDIMIYSPDVLVIRDDNYVMIKKKDQFKVNIISSAAVDNRHNIKNADSMMYTRIQKIIKLAASENMNAKGKSVLILGAFGCGVFKNDTKTISELFAKVLLNEGLKDYFSLIVFPIYKGSPQTTQIFQTALKPVGKKI